MTAKYDVFDALAPVLSDNVRIDAANGATAIRQYMKSKGIAGSIKRSASRTARFRAMRIVAIDGKHYADGNAQWYEVQS